MSSFKKLLHELGAVGATPNETVRIFRNGLGMTLKEVEEVTGIRESHLSAIENGKIEITQHYAEVFATTFGLHPTIFLYPNGEFKKSKELELIEQKAKKFIIRARPENRSKKQKRIG